MFQPEGMFAGEGVIESDINILFIYPSVWKPRCYLTSHFCLLSITIARVIKETSHKHFCEG